MYFLVGKGNPFLYQTGKNSHSAKKGRFSDKIDKIIGEAE